MSLGVMLAGTVSIERSGQPKRCFDEGAGVMTPALFFVRGAVAMLSGARDWIESDCENGPTLGSAHCLKLRDMRRDTGAAFARALHIETAREGADAVAHPLQA
jgi:hypothetical protein